MRLVQVRDGVLEVRWTWMPFWLAVNPKMKQDLEQKVHDGVLMSGVSASEADLDALHDFLIQHLQGMFPSHQGLAEYLDGLKYVVEPS